MSEALAGRLPRGRAALAATLRLIWFVLVPATLTVLVLRYLLQSPARTPAGVLRELSAWAAERQALLALGFFVLFSALIRYWRPRLPAAKLWTEPAAAPASGPRATLLWVALMLVAAAAALLLRGSLFQSYRVLSGSMLPTFQPDDLMLSTEYAYGLRAPWGTPRLPAAPKRGDAVVFRRPPLRPDVPEELVKRVVGLPGDVINVTQAGYVYINDWRVPTCTAGNYVFIAGEGMLEARLVLEFLDDATYLTAHGPWEPEPRVPYTVKPGEVFVLGDNRNNSSDSRSWNEGRGGGLRFEEIRGRVDRFLLWSRRDGSLDAGHLFERVGLQFRTEGIDDTELRAGVERCLKARPKDTRPPRPGAAPAPQSSSSSPEPAAP